MVYASILSVVNGYAYLCTFEAVFRVFIPHVYFVNAVDREVELVLVHKLFESRRRKIIVNDIFQVELNDNG